MDLVVVEGSRMTETAVDEIFPDIFRKSFPLSVAIQTQAKISEMLFTQVNDKVRGIAFFRTAAQLALQKARIGRITPRACTRPQALGKDSVVCAKAKVPFCSDLGKKFSNTIIIVLVCISIIL
jgi:hypothetical protein